MTRPPRNGASPAAHPTPVNATGLDGHIRPKYIDWKTPAVLAPFKAFYWMVILLILAWPVFTVFDAGLGLAFFRPGALLPTLFLALIVASLRGLPFYALFGVPLLVATVRRGMMQPVFLAGMAFVANILGAAGFAVLSSLMDWSTWPVLPILLTGGLVAPVWGYAFGRILIKGGHHDPA